MNVLHDKTIAALTFTSRSVVGATSHRPAASEFPSHPSRKGRKASRFINWRRRFEEWRSLMGAAQAGESRAYEQLLREIDLWLRRYYAQRLPHSAAEDARQEVLLAVHANRHAYTPSRPFGPWIKAIARHKWIDRLRDSSRFAAFSLNDGIAIEDHGEAALSSIVVNDLLGRLKPAQARVIRLVKLQGISVEGASSATGQSAALVKVNIHRGLKKLAALANSDAVVPATAGNSKPDRPGSRSQIAGRAGSAGICNESPQRPEGN